MVRKILFAVAICVPILCVTASAQSVDEIVTKSIDARGGRDKIKALSTVTMTGSAVLGPGLQAPVIVRFKRPGSLRMEFTVQDQAVIQATDGASAWSLNPFEGVTKPAAMSAEDAKDVAQEADLDGPLMDAKAKGNSIELVGKEQVDGADVFKLKVTLKSGDVNYIYIDTTSFLERKESTTRTQQGSQVEIESYPTNYKAVEGVLFPFSIENKVAGTTQFKMTIDSIEANKSIDDGLFKLPPK